MRSEILLHLADRRCRGNYRKYRFLSISGCLCCQYQVVSDFDHIVVEVDVTIREHVEARHQPAYHLRIVDLGLIQNFLGRNDEVSFQINDKFDDNLLIKLRN